MSKLRAHFKTRAEQQAGLEARAQGKVEQGLRRAIDAAARENRKVVVHSLKPARTMMQIVALCGEAGLEFKRSAGKGRRIIFNGGGSLRLREPSPTTRG